MSGNHGGGAASVCEIPTPLTGFYKYAKAKRKKSVGSTFSMKHRWPCFRTVLYLFPASLFAWAHMCMHADALLRTHEITILPPQRVAQLIALVLTLLLLAAPAYGYGSIIAPPLRNSPRGFRSPRACYDLFPSFLLCPSYSPDGESGTHSRD